MILAITLGAARLGETIVHADAAARGDPLHVAVEHFSAALILVEAEMAEVVQQSTRLR